MMPAIVLGGRHPDQIALALVCFAAVGLRLANNSIFFCERPLRRRDQVDLRQAAGELSRHYQSSQVSGCRSRARRASADQFPD
jgi:hypothetical protein